MRDIVITHGVRTPIGKIGGWLKDCSDLELAAKVMENLVNERANIDLNEIDHVVHRQCGSGLQAIMDACQMIAGEEAKVMIAGGPGSTPVDQYGSLPMGMTAENPAEQYHISRRAQDEFAQRSQERIANAVSEGRFDEQILPVETKKNGQKIVFSKDEHPFLSNIEKLGTLRPVFKKDGSVTAGNASGRNDGAAAVLIMDKDEADRLGYQPLVKIRAVAASGCAPEYMGIGPVQCTQIALERAGLKLDDMDVIELNEAFAAQSLAVMEEWKAWGVEEAALLEKINPNGGAIAHGHPLGCTGAALCIKCMYELKRVPEKKYGLITLCCAGGLGVAVILEKVSEE